MQYAIQLSLAIIMLTAASCSFHSKYESLLISQAESIKDRPVSRNQLIKTFGLQEIKSRVLPEPVNRPSNSINLKNGLEVWKLAHGYQLSADANADLIVSAESNQKEQEWRKTVVGRDYFVIEFAPISFCKEGRSVTSKGKEIYPSKKQ